MLRIPEIELAFSNACTANCFLCSKVHGGDNVPFMSWEVFEAALSSMKSINFDIVQTGGDGDSFLNDIYIDALRELKKAFPLKSVRLYSNFALFDRDKIDTIIGENLVSHVFTRIDSLDPVISTAASNLDQKVVFGNIDYFLKNNKKIAFQINYSNIRDYKKKCMRVLGKEPFYWNHLYDTAPEDEYEEVKKRFNTGKVTFDKIKQSLWAERNDDDIAREPDMPCERTYCFNSTCYVWTDGDVGICGYDDGQDAMIIGNVLEETIEDIWLGERRLEMIRSVENREVKGYPCVNPKACLFY